MTGYDPDVHRGFSHNLGFAAPSAPRPRLRLALPSAPRASAELPVAQAAPAPAPVPPTVPPTAPPTAPAPAPPTATAPAPAPPRAPPAAAVVDPARWCRVTTTGELLLFMTDESGKPYDNHLRTIAKGDEAILYYPMIKIENGVFMRYNDVDKDTGALRVLLAQISTGEACVVSNFRVS
jgi:hypothetical protein